MEKLSEEFQAIGFYLSGHPLDQYDRVLKKLGIKKFSEFEILVQRGATAGRLAGIVIAARERRSQKGNKFAFATFSDATGQFDFTFTPPVPGTYAITASFGGSNSYFASSSQTHMNFNMPAAATTNPTTPASNAADLYLLPGIIAIIVVIIIVGAVNILAQRKRP
jgi:hypothetical protein